RNYTVIPLASRSGLIQWVEGATPLFTLYKRWQQRQATALTWKVQNDNQEIALATGKQPVEDRREVPMPILRQCIEELTRETPADLLSRELWCSCPSVGLWYKNVQSYREIRYEMIFKAAVVNSMEIILLSLSETQLDDLGYKRLEWYKIGRKKKRRKLETPK
ncbi:unnamed protein product, partial [Rotaria magnacalcarata]